MKERETEEGKQKISYIRELFMKWRCERKSCSNYGHLCISVGKRHYRLNSNDLTKWNVAILTTKATIDAPPLDLHPMFANDVQKRRNSGGYSSDIEDERDSHHRRVSHGQNISVHLHRDSHRSKRRYFSSSPPSSPIREQRDVYARTSIRSPFSSPSIKHISLSEYVEWHASNAPEDAEAYFSALAALNTDRIKVSQLGKLTDSQWDAYGVPWGIYTSLKTGINDFKGEKGLGKVYLESNYAN